MSETDVGLLKEEMARVRSFYIFSKPGIFQVGARREVSPTDTQLEALFCDSEHASYITY